MNVVNENEWIVPIVKIEDIRPHTNADNLELCNILGYQLCIQKGLRKNGDKAIYFQPDTIIPEKWVDKLGISEYLRGKQKNRVSQIRLRGEYSFGLLIDVPKKLMNKKIGDNVSSFYGAKKYEPPLVFPNAISQNNKQSKKDIKFDRYIKRYTKIVNGRTVTNIFNEEEEIVVTEKIHGCNAKLIHVVPLKLDMAASMGRSSFSGRRQCPTEEDNSFFIKRIWNNFFKDKNKNKMFVKPITDYSRKEIRTNTYWFPWSVDGVEKMIRAFASRKGVKTVTVYGEIYGGSIQTLTYGIAKGSGYGFAVFDIAINGEYIGWTKTEESCNEFGVKTVPVLYKGKFNYNIINNLADGQTTLNAKNIREGVVVRTTTERIHPRLGRKILKYIGNEYMLSKHKKKDTTDV